MKFIGALLCFGWALTACDSPQQQECREDLASENGKDSATVQSPAVSSTTGDDLVKETTKKYARDKKENHAKIVQKYGEQWDFCSCVVASDSINKASQNGITEKQAEKLMKRWEYIETRCKEFMTNPNTTPDERAAHEKKVEKCLKNM